MKELRIINGIPVKVDSEGVSMKSFENKMIVRLEGNTYPSMLFYILSVDEESDKIKFYQIKDFDLSILENKASEFIDSNYEYKEITDLNIFHNKLNCRNYYFNESENTIHKFREIKPGAILRINDTGKILRFEFTYRDGGSNVMEGYIIDDLNNRLKPLTFWIKEFTYVTIEKL